MLHAVLGVVIGTICYCLNDVDCSLGRLMVVPVFLFFSFSSLMWLMLGKEEQREATSMANLITR